jgi:hypothetical protein
MKVMKYITFLMLVVAFCSPFITSAHSNIKIENTVGNYHGVMTFFGDAPFANERTVLTFRLFSLPEDEIVEFSKASVSVSEKGKTKVVGQETLVTDGKPPFYLGDFFYEFPKPGEYVLTATFEKDGEIIVIIPFDLLVYASENGNDLPPAVENNLIPIRIGLVVGIAIVLGLGWFLLRKRA